MNWLDRFFRAQRRRPVLYLVPTAVGFVLGYTLVTWLVK